MPAEQKQGGGGRAPPPPPGSPPRPKDGRAPAELLLPVGPRPRWRPRPGGAVGGRRARRRAGGGGGGGAGGGRRGGRGVRPQLRRVPPRRRQRRGRAGEEPVHAGPGGERGAGRERDVPGESGTRCGRAAKERLRADWKGTADLRREIQDAGFRRGLRTSGRLYCKFVVTDTTGNTAIAGTLSVTGHHGHGRHCPEWRADPGLQQVRPAPRRRGDPGAGGIYSHPSRKRLGELSTAAPGGTGIGRRSAALARKLGWSF